MKILVTNNTLEGLGGSETYAYALLSELNRRPDIDVYGFGTRLGIIAKKLSENGVKITKNLVDEYDLVLSSHNSTTKLIKNFSCKKIQTCHGIYPALEQPDTGMDKYVSISEEVKLHLLNKGIDSNIIHNGVNCDRFSPFKSLNPEIKVILSLSHSRELNNLLKKICESRGIKLICLNKYVNPVFDVENVINSADLVVTLGRGAYESMACGRNVLILDKRPYINKPPLGDGLITKDNIDLFIKNNCSGRYSNKIFSEKDIIDELDKYDPILGDYNRQYALENLNIEKQVEKYLNL